MTSGTTRRAFARAAGVSVVAIASLTVWLALGIGGRTATVYVDDIATVAAALIAAAFCVAAARGARGRERKVWGLLAAAVALWALGEVAWGIYDLVLQREVPSPSWADIGYLGAIPFAVAALASHPATGRNATRTARYLFDGLLIATALLYLSWTLVLEPLGRMTDVGTAAGAVTFAYPFGDVVLLFFVALVIRGMRGGNRLPLWCLLGGLGAMALADSAFAFMSSHGYETGNVIDVGWIAGYAGIAVGAIAARVPAPDVQVKEAPSPTLAVLVAPFLLVLVALSVAAGQMTAGMHLGTVALALLGALISLVLVRQALLLREYVGSAGSAGVRASERLVYVATGGRLSNV